MTGSHLPSQDQSTFRFFLNKMRHGAHLQDADKAELISLVQRIDRIEAGGEILREGAEPHSIALVLEGWACRYKILADGKRLITSLFVSGDLCEPFGVLPRFMDHTLSALTPVFVGRLPLSSIRKAIRDNPRIEEALWWDLLVTTAIEREHMVSLGRRLSVECLGHLICELQLRLEMAGMMDGPSFDLPVTQVTLGDLFGLSVVQTNRSLQELRKLGLISLRRRRVTIRNLAELQALSHFDETYLQSTGLEIA